VQPFRLMLKSKRIKIHKTMQLPVALCVCVCVCVCVCMNVICIYEIQFFAIRGELGLGNMQMRMFGSTRGMHFLSCVDVGFCDVLCRNTETVCSINLKEPLGM
jgi:hypothetical protein